MKLTSSSTARRSTALAASRSGGSPQMPLPVIRMAPKPIRFTVRSPPIPMVPAALAVTDGRSAMCQLLMGLVSGNTFQVASDCMAASALGIPSLNESRGANGADMRGIRGWRRGLIVVAVASLLAACGGDGGGTGGTPTLNWYVFHEPSGSFQNAAASCSAASGGAYNIKIQELPTAADGQRQQLVRRSAAKDSSLDILGLDVVWEAEFAEAGWVENWTGDRERQVRQDLVPDPPKTWDEMIQQAETLASQGKPHYIEIQGSSYEGYTVWINEMILSAGGQILSDDGQRVILGPRAARAVSVSGKMARSTAADPGLAVTM